MFQTKYIPPKSPENELNIFSLLTFSWLTNFIMNGYINPIKEEEIFEKKDGHKISEQYEKFLKYERRR